MKCRNFFAAIVPFLTAAATFAAGDPLSLSGDADLPIGAKFRANAPTADPTKPETPKTDPADKKKQKGPTEITSNEASIDNRQNLAVFIGTVEVKNVEYNVTCDKLTVYLRKQKGKVEAKPGDPKAIGAEEPEQPKPAAKDDSSSDGIEKAIAEGNVILIQDRLDENGKKQRYYGKARKAVFDQDKKTCVLYGWPRISQSLNETVGKEMIAMQESTVITLDQAGVIKAEGLNQVRLIDVSALDMKPDQKNDQKPDQKPEQKTGNH